MGQEGEGGAVLQGMAEGLFPPAAPGQPALSLKRPMVQPGTIPPLTSSMPIVSHGTAASCSLPASSEQLTPCAAHEYDVTPVDSMHRMTSVTGRSAERRQRSLACAHRRGSTLVKRWNALRSSWP